MESQQSQDRERRRGGEQMRSEVFRGQVIRKATFTHSPTTLTELLVIIKKKIRNKKKIVLRTQTGDL